MGVLSAGIAVVMLATLSAAGALARGREVHTSGVFRVECAGEPETVTVRNTSRAGWFVVEGIEALGAGRSLSFGRSDLLGPGQSITYYSGPEAQRGATTLTRHRLFPDDTAPTEQVVRVTVDTFAADPGGEFGASFGCPSPPDEYGGRYGGRVHFGGPSDIVPRDAVQLPGLPDTGAGGTAGAEPLSGTTGESRKPR